ncbi:MAG: SLC13 family permease [Pirellulales bacterium]
MQSLSLDGWISLLVTLAILIGLQRRRDMPVDLLFLGGLVAVTVLGVITPAQALSGFASTAVITIAALFAAAAALRSTGVLDWIGQRLLGNVHSEGRALWRLVVTVVPVSAFLLNTPLVAMLAPVVVDWCRKHSISPSRLLMPLSYLTILGGVCTLIGTSTTLVINDLLLKLATDGTTTTSVFGTPIEGIGFFEITRAGVPCAVVGAAYILLVGRRLLPNRTELIEQLGDKRREYLVEMLVQPGCPLVGKSVEAAGLRHLPGLFLIEIDRDGNVVTPVTPRDVIEANDRLVFTGVVTTIADLEKIPGLVPAVDMTYEVDPRMRQQRHLTEAVLSRTSPLVGHTVREANFRERYNAAIVAVHRNGVRLTNKIGNIRLEPGDTLLLQTRSDFVATHRHNRDFYLVSGVGSSLARRHDRALLAGGLFVLLIIWLAACNWMRSAGMPGGISSHAIAALTIAGAMIIARCVTISEARAAVDLQVLITIACALGLGTALQQSEAAEFIAYRLVDGVGYVITSPQATPYVLLAVIYLVAMFFTEMITNVAVATMLIPVAIGVADAADYSTRPFIMAIALAASLSFVTPIGYQTNLMVMGPGGYQPRDYLRVGLPLALLTALTALLVIPRAWPF